MTFVVLVRKGYSGVPMEDKFFASMDSLVTISAIRVDRPRYLTWKSSAVSNGPFFAWQALFCYYIWPESSTLSYNK
jgi:hypothetical protein